MDLIKTLSWWKPLGISVTDLDFQFLFVALGIELASCVSNGVLYPKREVYHIEENEHLLLLHSVKHTLFLGNFCIHCLSF